MFFSKRIRKSFHCFLDLIYPPLCFSCNETLLQSEAIVCTQCKLDLPLLENLEIMQRIRNKLSDINPEFLSCFLYYRKGNATQELLHTFKYRGYENLGLHLGRWFGEFMLPELCKNKIDLIVPVPLHRRKLMKRGFNQSAIIASGISELSGLPLDETAIVRVSQNKSQTTKSRFSRIMDVREIFRVRDRSSIAGKHILLVDDVVTTGSTIASCATVLLNSGAEKVSIAALAAAQ